MTDPIILNDITAKLDPDRLIKALRITGREPLIKKMKSMLSAAEQLARPKAVVLAVDVKLKEDTLVLINGLEFKSRILKVNLEKSANVFAVVATAGQELDQWTSSKTDILHRFWADQMGDEVLSIAVNEAESKIRSLYKLDLISWMTPGSLEDWPLSEQQSLFKLFAQRETEPIVSLTDHFVMRPLKSLSGLVFSSEKAFFSCQLCNKKKCTKRRAGYDEGMAEEKYGIKSDTNQEVPISCH